MRTRDLKERLQHGVKSFTRERQEVIAKHREKLAKIDGAIETLNNTLDLLDTPSLKWKKKEEKP